MNRKQIYYDQRAGRTVASRSSFVLIYLLVPSICAWGIYLLGYALVVELPSEISGLGYSNRFYLVAITLAIGVVACTYLLAAFIYIFFFELPKQVSQLCIHDDRMILTPIIGISKSFEIEDILGLYLDRKPFYWHAPFSYSMVGWKFQRVLKTRSGSSWLLVENIVKKQNTDELIRKYLRGLGQSKVWDEGDFRR